MWIAPRCLFLCRLGFSCAPYPLLACLLARLLRRSHHTPHFFFPFNVHQFSSNCFWTPKTTRHIREGQLWGSHSRWCVLCVVCVCFFFSFSFFFFCLPTASWTLFLSFSLRSSQQMRPFVFPFCTYTFFGHWLLFFFPLFFACFIIYVLSFLCSVTLSTLLFTVVLSFFFFLSTYMTAYFYALFFFFSHPSPSFFFIDCSASHPFSPYFSRRHHSVFSPCDFGARFCVCTTLMMCFAWQLACSNTAEEDCRCMKSIKM